MLKRPLTRRWWLWRTDGRPRACLDALSTALALHEAPIFLLDALATTSSIARAYEGAFTTFPRVDEEERDASTNLPREDGNKRDALEDELALTDAGRLLHKAK